MNLISRSKLARIVSRSGGIMVLILAMAGCGRSDEVRVQRVPKPEPAAPSTLPAGHPAAGGPMDVHAHAGAVPRIKWALPAGWEEKPASQMRAGSFIAQAGEGKTADIAIIPLPSGGPEMELANLNMWRGEVQLDPAEKAEATTVAVGPGQGKLFEIASSKSPARILVAVLDREGMTWYFKMKGEDAFVKEQRPVFVEFLKSISFAEPKPFSTAELASIPPADKPPSDNSGKPVTWQVPAGWQEQPAGQFLFAKYSIQGAGDAKADVNISTSPGDGGGALPNINRWRGQLGLPPVTQEEEYSKLVRSFGAPEQKALQVDLSGTDGRTGKKARVIAVIVPRGGQTWFYKLMGDEQLVEQQKEAFANFVGSARYSHAL